MNAATSPRFDLAIPAHFNPCPSAFPYLVSAARGTQLCFDDPIFAAEGVGPCDSWCSLTGGYDISACGANQFCHHESDFDDFDFDLAKASTSWLPKANSVAAESRALSTGTGNNLVTNGGFENGATGWDSWGAEMSDTTEQAYEGTHSLLMAKRSHAFMGCAQNMAGILEDGVKYEMSAWVRLKNSTEEMAGFYVRVEDIDGNVKNLFDPIHASKQITGTPTYNHTWTQIWGVIDFFQPENVGRVLLRSKVNVPNVDFYLDDAYIAPFEPTSIIINGNMAEGDKAWFAYTWDTTKVESAPDVVRGSSPSLLVTGRSSFIRGRSQYPISGSQRWDRLVTEYTNHISFLILRRGAKFVND